MRQMLEKVGLYERRNNFPAQLSGGEQQRVAIARALVKRPRLLLCDDPTGALDDKTGSLILGLIRRMNKAFGTTVVLVTHNPTLVKMADRSITMRDGGIVNLSTRAKRLFPDNPDL